MADLTEKQARRICRALGVNPDARKVSPEEWNAIAGKGVGIDELRERVAKEGARAFKAPDPKTLGVPVWRIVQRAAAEEKP